MNAARPYDPDRPDNGSPGAIDNWPPGYPAVIALPPGLVGQIDRARDALAALMIEADAWSAWQRERRRMAWYLWHEAHGWWEGASRTAPVVRTSGPMPTRCECDLCECEGRDEAGDEGGWEPPPGDGP